MALKKSQLYSSLWKGCDELRGGMDASQYKDYVLALLFVKYVSDKFVGRDDAPFDVPDGCHFDDLIALKGKVDIGEKMNVLIQKLAEACGISVSALADFDEDSKVGVGKAKVERLSKLIGQFQNLDFKRNRADGDDLLGDAYEFLMRHFATESGKSKGQFYTPAEVSRIMARVIGAHRAHDKRQTFYDPACGSGSLLIKAHDEALAAGFDLAIYGQEMDNATATLAQMNMILHDCASAEIHNGNTLAAPYWKGNEGALKAHDFVVANPPFSTKSWTSGVDFNMDNATFRRFADYGRPPEKNGDYAFLLHILASLKPTGRGAVILPHGVLFRGHAEALIREQLVRRGVIEAIIGLPANLFYGTGIPACIVVLDKAGAAGRDGIWMIDASREFAKDGNKNRLRARDIHRIIDCFETRTEIAGYARAVPFAEIADAANDFNLNLPRYLDGAARPDAHDIDAHLRGGIPDRDIDELEPFWREFDGLRPRLFAPHAREGYARPALDGAELGAEIEQFPAVAAWRAGLHRRFDGWFDAQRPALLAIGAQTKPKQLRAALSESLLGAFTGAPLVDAYAVYQSLCDHWDAQMGDDIDIIIGDGWQNGAQPLRVMDAKEKADLTVERKKWSCELVPPALIVARYFADDQRRLDELEAGAATLGGELDELREEQGGEEGYLGALKDDDGKFSDKDVKTRLIAARKEMGAGLAPSSNQDLSLNLGLEERMRAGLAPSSNQDVKEKPRLEEGASPALEEEIEMLERYLNLSEREASARRAVKAASERLDERTLVKYGHLSAPEVQTLVLDDKWRAALLAGLNGEIERALGALTGRASALAARYSTTLPQLQSAADDFAARAQATWLQLGFEL